VALRSKPIEHLLPDEGTAALDPSIDPHSCLEAPKTVLDQGSSWDGYCVIQAKYRAEPASKPTENAAWLRRMIDKELDDWADEGSRRDEIPKYIIFVTNIELSSVPNTGGLDALAAHINKRLRPPRVVNGMPSGQGVFVDLYRWKIHKI
jgi:hypothetical protein